MAEKEWVVQFDDTAAVGRLKTALLSLDQVSRKAGGGCVPDDMLVFVVDRFAGLRVEVVAREHAPPHFRVSCGRESANYRIADCAQLNGDLCHQYRIVRDWHKENKQRIIAAWNRLRPTGCPVGEYREV